MRIKVIKTEKEYEEALRILESLMEKTLDDNDEGVEKLELLATLIHDYEAKMFQENLPDPVDAILFRMEQQGLTQKDLENYIGSKSKVSEVLSRKRPITLNMMPALVDGLGIPAKVLLNQKREDTTEPVIQYDTLPIKELIGYGYVTEVVKENKEKLQEEINNLLKVFDRSSALAYLRKTNYVRSSRPVNMNNLILWAAKVVGKANALNDIEKYDQEKCSPSLIEDIVKISSKKNAIEKVIGHLHNLGIAVIIEPHLPKTYLDGAAILSQENPIIGLTLRHDRLDNFWFTLLHELAHIILHRESGTNLFYDNMDSPDYHNVEEREADDLVRKTIVSDDVWSKSPASIVPTKEAALKLAEELNIHPSIVAGKMRYENKQHHYLKDMVGYGEVRVYFPEIKWLKK